MSLSRKFERVVERLIQKEELNLYEEDVSVMFEIIASNLLGGFLQRESMYFDGVADLTSSIRKSRQVEFLGDMWVGQNQKQWKESFRALVTDKRNTKQGIWIKIRIGVDEAEGDLTAAFNEAVA